MPDDEKPESAARHKSISQEELAKQQFASRQTINAMEKEKHVPSTVLTLKPERYFGKAVEEILRSKVQIISRELKYSIKKNCRFPLSFSLKLIEIRN